ncbi:DUF6364 family protein [Daejeonella sp.]|uniref:DUF6364 family protein n=1 Tax=Daejeonella sp. TaxID=2805397 RepID=UPI00271CD45D|nr:DUF6364 family protein [Daejeonella sp.]MDO8993699.1 DUF6364 family protein [Daejeonella sp.]MDP2415713.1 DUF6364 family protein [Daejeonella sp.]
MANTKLTLSMEPEVVYRAKQYAKKRHISLSKLIQDFLENSIESDNLKDDPDLNIPEEIEKLRGILKGSDLSKKQLKQIKLEYLKEKHGL